MIDELHDCLSQEFHGGAYKWIDDNFNDAWSKSVDRFESAIVLSHQTGDSKLFQVELNYYRTSTLDFFRRYKQVNKEAGTQTFLEQLAKRKEAKQMKLNLEPYSEV